MIFTVKCAYDMNKVLRNTALKKKNSNIKFTWRSLVAGFCTNSSVPLSGSRDVRATIDPFKLYI